MKVELVGHYGGDETHSLSAWTSTKRELTEERQRRMGGMLTFLAKEGHHTPFEKSYLHFLVEADTASHIHLLKHRIGVSVNGESARYKQMEPRHYVPDDWPTQLKRDLESVSNVGEWFYERAMNELEPILGRKRAKESARFFLTYANVLTLDVSFNWRSFSHFLSLRNKEDAQLEIHEIAKSMLLQVKSIPGEPFKLTIEAFDSAGLLGDYDK